MIIKPTGHFLRWMMIGYLMTVFAACLGEVESPTLEGNGVALGSPLDRHWDGIGGEIYDPPSGLVSKTDTWVDIEEEKLFAGPAGGQLSAEIVYQHPEDLKVWVVYNLQSVDPATGEPLTAEDMWFADLSVGSPQWGLTYYICNPDYTQWDVRCPKEIEQTKAFFNLNMFNEGYNPYTKISGQWQFILMDHVTDPDHASADFIQKGNVAAWRLSFEETFHVYSVYLPIIVKNYPPTPIPLHETFEGPMASSTHGTYDQDWSVEPECYGSCELVLDPANNGSQILRSDKGGFRFTGYFGDVGGKILYLQHRYTGNTRYWIRIGKASDPYLRILDGFSSPVDGGLKLKLPPGTDRIQFDTYEWADTPSELALFDLEIKNPTSVCGDRICTEVEEDAQSCPLDCARGLALVVDGSLWDALMPKLLQYVSDLDALGVAVHLSRFQGGSAADLRQFLRGQRTSLGIAGAFLVGNIPAAWCESSGLGYGREEFPCDIFLGDLTTQWMDVDGDGLFDNHSFLHLELFIARVMGTSSELQSYFDRVHLYRTQRENFQAPRSAYVFIEDDWNEGCPCGDWGLDQIYQTITKHDTRALSTKANYVSFLSSTGAELVYQNAHSTPSALYIHEDFGWNPLTVDEIRNASLKGSFYHLDNCSAARFSEPNLAMTYVVQTPTGLAAVGSTKVTTSGPPEFFHDLFQQDITWGEAFRRWYNQIGAGDDLYFLGMTVIGDPLLKLSKDVPLPNRAQTLDTGSQKAKSPQVQQQWKENYLKQLKFLRESESAQQPCGYKEYKQNNPQFFFNSDSK